MKRTDDILAITRALLTASEKEFSIALASVREVYEINATCKPGTVSIGFVNDGYETSFTQWLNDLRNKKVTDVVFFSPTRQRPDLEPHIAAAFAGPSDLLMQIKTGDGLTTYQMTSYYSPYYEIRPKHFIELFDAQADPQLIWKRVYNLILDSNRLNNRTEIEFEETKEYILLPEGGSVLDSLAGEIFKEIQIECAINNLSFIIPDKLQSFFVKHEPFDFGINNDKEYVYLYAVRSVTAEEALTLAEAQPFESEIWERLNKTLEEWQDEQMKPMPVEQWKGKFMSLEPVWLGQYINALCRSICTLCEDKNLKPVIPAGLSDAFGPNEEDQKRAATRSKIEGNLWSLQSTKQPWEFYGFWETEFEIEPERYGIHDIKHAFVAALKDIEMFAADIHSNFHEAFKLALFLVQEEIDLNKILVSIKDAGFSDRAGEVLQGRLWIAEHFSKLGYSNEEVNGLLSISIADVFGGMGSWNDQYVEDQERYSTVSVSMYNALRNYFAVIISKSA